MRGFFAAPRMTRVWAGFERRISNGKSQRAGWVRFTFSPMSRPQWASPLGTPFAVRLRHGWGTLALVAGRKQRQTADGTKACLATSIISIHAPFKRSCDRSCRSTPYCGTWSSPCRCLPCQAEAGGGSRDRSVPRRLSRPLPRRLQDGEWVQPVPEARGVLHGLLLRLCQYDDGSGALDRRHGRLYQWAWHLAE